MLKQKLFDVLNDLGACSESIEYLQTQSEIGEAVAGLQADWLGWIGQKLYLKARKTYEEAIDAAGKTYQEATTPAWKTYQEACAPAWKMYHEACAPARKTYHEAIAAAEKTYQETIAPAWKTYDKARAPAWKTYEVDARIELIAWYEGL